MKISGSLGRAMMSRGSTNGKTSIARPSRTCVLVALAALLQNPTGANRGMHPGSSIFSQPRYMENLIIKELVPMFMPFAALQRLIPGSWSVYSASWILKVRWKTAAYCTLKWNSSLDSGLCSQMFLNSPLGMRRKGRLAGLCRRKWFWPCPLGFHAAGRYEEMMKSAQMPQRRSSTRGRSTKLTAGLVLLLTSSSSKRIVLRSCGCPTRAREGSQRLLWRCRWGLVDLTCNTRITTWPIWWRSTSWTRRQSLGAGPILAAFTTQGQLLGGTSCRLYIVHALIFHVFFDVFESFSVFFSHGSDKLRHSVAYTLLTQSARSWSIQKPLATPYSWSSSGTPTTCDPTAWNAWLASCILPLFGANDQHYHRDRWFEMHDIPSASRPTMLGGCCKSFRNGAKGVASWHFNFW